MANKRKLKQSSNRTLIYETRTAVIDLESRLSALCKKLEQRDGEVSLFLGGLIYALAEAFPDKFLGPDGKPRDVFTEHVNRLVAAQQQQANSDVKLTIVGGDNANG